MKLDEHNGYHSDDSLSSDDLENNNQNSLDDAQPSQRVSEHRLFII